ncbi:MAG TPA: hypothetical protein PLX71_03030 [Phycicoccus sp.]|nr:hypothetical protein [Phycicoccus sp.]
MTSTVTAGSSLAVGARAPEHAPRPASGAVTVVTGASGGLGASTLAAAVAAEFAGQAGTGVLVDLDLDGGGLDVTCGVEHLPGRRWPDFAGVRGAVDADRVIAGLPQRAGCALLAAGPSRRQPSAPVPGPGAIADVLGSLIAGGRRVVIDLPRWRLDLVPDVVDAWLVMSGTRTRELADLDALLERIAAGPAGATAPLLLATAGPAPSAALIAAIEAHTGVAHLGQVQRSPAVPTAQERGEWPGGRAFRGVTGPLSDRAWRRGAA